MIVATGTVYEIHVGDGEVVIDNFVGAASATDDASADMADTLQFFGTGLNASNMILRQDGADTVITFAGVSGLSVRLTNVLRSELANDLYEPGASGPFGNFIFDGQTEVQTQIDIEGVNNNWSYVLHENAITYLNGKGGLINGRVDSNDTIFGGAGDDSMYGKSGDDKLHGDAGHDVLDGGYGVDYLYGDSGNDMIYGGSGGDRLYGGSGDDYMSGDNGGDRMFGGTGIDLMFGGDGVDKIYGEDGDDQMYGEAEDDYLYGGAGNDMLSGGLGSDHLDGGTSTDDTDRVVYFDSYEAIRLTYTGDVTYGLGGTATGDVITNTEQFWMTSHDDIFTVEGDGITNTKNLYVVGEYGDDKITTGAGNDFLSGGSGYDELKAGAGDDSLFGDDGEALLTGGSGNDQFVFESHWRESDATHYITDFTSGEDTVYFWLNGILDTDPTLSPSAFAEWMDAHVSQSGWNTVITDVASAASVVLLNFDKDNLQIGDLTWQIDAIA